MPLPGLFEDIQKARPGDHLRPQAEEMVRVDLAVDEGKPQALQRPVSAMKPAFEALLTRVNMDSPKKHFPSDTP